MNNTQTPSTLYSIESETGSTTWFIDYEPQYNSPYRLFRNEHFEAARMTLGEILEYVFDKFGNTHLKLCKK
jgi:hypothetical protein